MREISRFKVRTETGAEYVVIELGSRIDTTSLDGRESMAGLSEFRTSAGQPVNKRGDTFEIVATGEKALRVE